MTRFNRDLSQLYTDQRRAYCQANADRDAAIRAARAECRRAKREADRRFDEARAELADDARVLA